ncbi:MAG: LAGLIDADG family homing endonuclease, partial [Sulfurimonas sp.]
FYVYLRKISLGAPFQPGLFQQLKVITNQFLKIKARTDKQPLSPAVRNTLLANIKALQRYLAEVERDHANPMVWKRIAMTYATSITDVAKDKGVYIKTRAATPTMMYFADFSKMNPKQEAMEQLKLDDPEMYEVIKDQKISLKQIDTRHQSIIAQKGELEERVMIKGRAVIVGKNPVTGEYTAYDRAWGPVPLERKTVVTEDGRSQERWAGEFVDRLDEREEERKRLYKQDKRATVANFKELRSLTSEEVDALPGDAESVSLTDDKAKSGKLTRILPVKYKTTQTVDGEGNPIEIKQKVISDGRFKGIFLDDLVSANGRMIEGSTYEIQPKSARFRGHPVVRDVAETEPYVTVAEVVENGKKQTKLMLKLPAGRNEAATDLRNKVYLMAANNQLRKTGTSSSVLYMDGTNRGTYYFDPKDFTAMQDALGSLSLSQGAMKEVKAYFNDLTRSEEAQAKENLGFYSMEEIGGFKRGMDLSTTQKRSLAWLDANGNRGLLALDTGVGKCVEKSTLIQTSRGLVPIQSLQPEKMEPDSFTEIAGEHVYVHGEYLPIKRFYYGGMKPTIRVKTKRGFELEGSLIHPICIRQQGGDGFVRLPDLQIDDYVCIQKGGNFPEDEPTLRIPVRSEFHKNAGCLKMYNLPDRLTPDLARLLGYIIAEGYVAQRATFSISQDSDLNPEVCADIGNLLDKVFGCSRQYRDCAFHIQSAVIRKYLEWAGVDYTKSADKAVPSVILRATRDSVIQFLKGYIDAEGSVLSNVIEISSASERLLKEVQILLLSLGIVSSRHSRRIKGYPNTYWRLNISGRDAELYTHIVGFVSARKQRKAERLASLSKNTNHDMIPYAVEMVEDLRFEITKRAGGSHNGGGLQKRFGNAFVHTLTHVRQGRRAPSRDFLQKMVSIATLVEADSTDAYSRVVNFLERDTYYDEVVSLEHGFKEVMDIEVDDPRHTFIGNGFQNHNSVCSVSSMQKFIRDGEADDGNSYTDKKGHKVQTNGKFLFVCPKSLKGNITKEVRKFLSETVGGESATPEPAKVASRYMYGAD